MLLADLPATCPGDRLQELIAHPELKEAVRHENVAGAAAEVLADADLLRVDADEAVASHQARDPLLTVALRTAQLPLLVADLGLKSTLWGDVGQRLVRTLRVVVGNPLIERLLGRLQVPEDLPGVELDAETAVEALDLAGGGRRARLGEDVVDAVLPTDAVEQDLDRWLS